MSKRLNDAVAIRDSALLVLKFEGLPVADVPGHQLTLKFDGITISYRTPPIELPKSVREMMAMVARDGQQFVYLGYGLDIWDEQYGGKVLNLEWNNEGYVDLVSFRRGPWEDKILRFYDFFQSCSSNTVAAEVGEP